METKREIQTSLFVGMLPKLRPIDVCTLAKLMRVPLRDPYGAKKDATVIIDDLIDTFVDLDKKDRTFYLKVLKATINRYPSGYEVTEDGASTGD